jgi:Big-like domain-containing protein
MAGPPVTVSIDNTDLNLAHGTATVTFTFSAPPPLGFALDDTSAVGGTLSNLSQLNATTYTATFSAAANTDLRTRPPRSRLCRRARQARFASRCTTSCRPLWPWVSTSECSTSARRTVMSFMPSLTSP